MPGPTEAQAAATPTRDAGGASRRRWRICSLLFFITTLNYVDRQLLGVLAPELQRVIGWTEIEYGHIVTAFTAAYAVGLLAAGGFIDRAGTRIGYAAAIAVWSLATVFHAAARTPFAFGAARFLLGLSEAANFPAAVKTVAEWFPKRERALATGIFNSGTNVGAIVAPLAAPWITVTWGWPWAFVILGALSALWIVPWLALYRKPDDDPGISPAELAYIRSDPPEPAARITWARLLPHRQTWAFLVGKFLTDPIWWFFLYWLPKFLHAKHGLTLTGLGWPLVAIYTLSTVGSLLGGWFPARLLQQGRSLNQARKLAMLTCALLVVPIVFAATTDHLWLAVALIGLATAAHQGWSANLFTMVSDMFPRPAVASVVGIGGFGGAVGGMLIATFTGFLLEFTGSYLPVFVFAGSAYLVAFGAIQLLVPRLEAPRLDGES